MAKISITYPESWLNPTISVVNKTTGLVDFSWTMTEVWTTKSYWYEFSDVAKTDYVFTISVQWYNDVVDSLIYDTITNDIWTAQISDYSWKVWSFANKFEHYWGVSHVIDRSSLDEESIKRIDEIKELLKDNKVNIDYDKIKEHILLVNSHKYNDSDIIKEIQWLRRIVTDGIINKKPIVTTINNPSWIWDDILVELVPEIIDIKENVQSLWRKIWNIENKVDDTSVINNIISE